MPFGRTRFYQSLRFRLTLWNTAVVFLIVLASLIIVHEGLRLTLLRENEQRLKEDMQELGQAIQDMYPNWDAIHEEMNRKALGHAHRGQFVQVLNSEGTVDWSSKNTPANFANLPSLPGDQSLLSVGPYRIFRQIWRFPNLPPINVRVATNTNLIDDEVSRLTNLMLLVSAIMLIVAPIGGYWLAGRATEPLAEMHSTAAKLRPIQLEERLPIRGTGDELDRLSATINGLLDRIGVYLAQHRQFIANAAHELRSPLAAIQSSVEVALNSQRTPEEYQELLGELVEESSNLRLLVNQLLLLAESEGGMPQSGFESVDLSRLLTRSTDMFRAAAEEQGIEIVTEHLDNAIVRGHAGHLRQVVNNLIDNGIKFNHPGGKLVVSLHAHYETATAVMRFADSGVGIPAEDLPHIFERFYRGDKSRQREDVHPGTGLGLSIVDAIVRGHAGEIRATSGPDGTSFSVTLPLAAVQSATERPPAETPRAELTET
jgi:two-component system, OmpR family, heavy metal sensor histidine kinase CusS